MHGHDLAVHPDDLEVIEAQQETKKEVLENKDVSFICCLNKMYSIFIPGLADIDGLAGLSSLFEVLQSYKMECPRVVSGPLK